MLTPGAFCVLIAGCRCPSRTVIRPAACAAGFAQRADRRREVDRLPLQILAEGNIAGRIILLEPRRPAARNVAQRLAELLGEKPGETVGFRMRAETCVGPQTRLEVVTEGDPDAHDPARSGADGRGTGDPR